MSQGKYLSAVVIFLWICAVSTQVTDDGFYATIQHKIETDFSPAFTALNESFQAFLGANNEMNETKTSKPWLVEFPPGSGNMTFNPIGIMEFKGKIMNMVITKTAYIKQKTALETQVTQALYNMSIPLFATLSSPANAKISPSKGSTGSGIDTLGLIYKIFGLPTGDGKTESGLFKSAPKAGSLFRKRRQSGPVGSGSASATQSVWRENALKKKEEFLTKKMTYVQDKKQAWARFVEEKLAALGVNKANDKSDEHVDEDEMPQVVASRTQLLADIKDNLWEKFEARIVKLNETRNTFLSSKATMVERASRRAWEKASTVTGSVEFNPKELLDFKDKIFNMVQMKTAYYTEKKDLKEDMETELTNLLMKHLDAVDGDGLTEYIDLVLDELQQIHVDDVILPIDDTNGDSDIDDAFVAEITLDEDVLTGLPFASALKLAALQDSSEAAAGDGSSSSTILLITLGAVAVVAVAAMLVGVALRDVVRRRIYTRVI